MTEQTAHSSLRLLAIGHVGLAVVMGRWPRVFHRYLARFGRPNEHFIRDVATFDATLGWALWRCASHAEWRRPVLAVALMQNGLHFLHHLHDGRTGGPRSPSALDTGALLALEVVFAIALQSEHRTASHRALRAAPVPA